ncbi:MAG: hypothetical protein LAO79_01300 [Acidobacteriia bacterium]|nr:hypothetical protein [Terriglobia bacterium]
MEKVRNEMVQPFLRLVLLACAGSFAMPLLLSFVGIRSGPTPPHFALSAIGLACFAGIATFLLSRALRKLTGPIDASALAQARFVDEIDTRFIDAAIIVSAALSLFLELSMIRWQASVVEFFAFYKNFSLLACFMGLGLGYALANSNRLFLILTLPLLGYQFLFITTVRFGIGNSEMLRTLPFREQLTMGIPGAGISQMVALYALLAVVFLLTALAFVPVGQLCGRLMERRGKLRAYGLNLLGSLLGVAASFAASLLWTPPPVWFALCFLAVLLFHLKKGAALTVGLASTLACTAILAWPVDPLWGRIYSPYQLLELGRSPDTGLTLIRAAGHYYQRIYDFAADSLTPRLAKIRGYYDFPYKTHADPAEVAVVGAGTGNDVAAALRNGAGHVDAIEIDPAILLVGQNNHPEKPYSSPRVTAIVNDARSFLRTTSRKYDLIVYGLLDSHTLLSQGSSVRLDSFVYTVEGLREARSRLKPDGVLSLSFAVMSDQIGRKIYLMMQEAFDGKPPFSVIAPGRYDDSIIFLESNDDRWKLSPALLAESGFTDQTAKFADSSIKADVSTDDWPFFYMPQRVYPASYLIMVVLILVLSTFTAANFVRQKPQFSHASFFFLGVGFMLIETKGITELGLTFGNTWQVIGVVMAGILTMAFLGNCVVGWLKITQPFVPYLFLWISLAVGWFVSRSGGFASTSAGRIETVLLLTCPLLFSGMVFSALLSTKGAVSGMMAMNLLGAICGGLVEYNSMYFGFRALYAIAMGFYLLAFVSDLLANRPRESAARGPRVTLTLAEREP